MKVYLFFILTILLLGLKTQSSCQSFEFPDQHLNGKELNELAWKYYFHNIDTMKTVLDKALLLNKYDPKQLAETYNYYGVYYELKAKTDVSLEFYNKAIHIQKTHNDSSGLAFTYSNIGLLYYTLHEYEKAKINQLKSQELNLLLKDSLSLANNYLNLGIIYSYLKKGEYTTSIEHYNKAIDIYKKNNENYLLSSAYFNLAKLYIEKKEYQKALALYQKVMTLSPDNEEFYQATNFGIANIYYEQQNYTKALTHLNKATSSLEKRGIIEKLKYNYELYYNIYLKLQNSDSALYYFKKETTIRDSIFNKKIKEKLIEIELKYKIEQKDKRALELQLEKERAEINNVLAKNKIKKLYFLIIFGVIISSFIVFQLIQKTKINKTLKQKNEIISNNLKEKEILLKEIHHRVKNNLQLVSTLLALQENEIKSDELKKIIDESRQRIKTIGLIHQAIYQNDNLGNLDIKEYIEALIAMINKMGNITPIKSNIKIENIKLSIDTAIPLALIINELYTNSIKHAFNSSHKNPEITICLEEKKKILFLSYADNGKGFDIANTNKNFGSKLIKSLSRQLKAKVEEFSSDKGTTIIMNIHRYETNNK